VALRADAARNRAAILHAARTLITSTGPHTGMDEIAAEAGVAVGTLYRHFPTKTDLVEAIMNELAGRLAADLDAALARIDAGGSAFAEITALLRRVAVQMHHDRALRTVAQRLGGYPPGTIEEPAKAALSAMIDAAHREGTVAADLTVDDIALLMAGMPDPEAPESARHRWADLAIRAIRP